MITVRFEPINKKAKANIGLQRVMQLHNTVMLCYTKTQFVNDGTDSGISMNVEALKPDLFEQSV